MYMEDPHQFLVQSWTGFAQAKTPRDLSEWPQRGKKLSEESQSCAVWEMLKGQHNQDEENLLSTSLFICDSKKCILQKQGPNLRAGFTNILFILNKERQRQRVNNLGIASHIQSSFSFFSHLLFPPTFFYFLVFLGPHPQHMEVSRLQV